MKKLRKKKKTNPWYEGASLQRATVGEWHQATWNNGMATACAYVLAASKLDAWQLPRFKSQDEVYGLCVKFCQVAIEGTKNHLDFCAQQKMSDLAPVVMGLLGWLKEDTKKALKGMEEVAKNVKDK